MAKANNTPTNAAPRKVMVTYKGKQEEVTQDFIINYCVENDKLDWLEKVDKGTYVDKGGKTKRNSFLQVRKLFVAEYFQGSTSSKSASDWHNKVQAALAKKG